ncbi:MAG: FtsX-like permease family protein [Planctomycetota bacterium]|jgi:hypothetical protein
MWLASERRGRLPIRRLLNLDLGGDGADAGASPRRSLILGVLFAAVATVPLVFVGAGKTRNQAAAFFTAGGLLLMAGLFLCAGLFAALARAGGEVQAGLGALAVRNAARRRGRSLAASTMLACGVFLIVAIGANRQDPMASAGERKSGTGGFAFYGETSIAVNEDLNTPEARRRYGLENTLGPEVTFVQMRLRDGDDASCLNLNRTSQPRILALRPGELQERGAFEFIGAASRFNREDGWLMLDADLGEGTIAAVADDAVITWGLGKSLGDTMEYSNEAGKTVRLKLVGSLANSIFQGSVIVSEHAFLKHFPSVSGRRVFLVDAPGSDAAEVRRALSRGLGDFGLDLQSAPARLAEFNAVQNTYLSIFLALGGLALVVGGIGMGVVVLRNALERRGELAIMRALGFGRGHLVRLLLWEHWLVLAAGLAVGVIAALVAVLPALLSPGARAPVGATAVIIAAVAASGAGWVYLTSRIALRGELLAALRNE